MKIRVYLPYVCANARLSNLFPLARETFHATEFSLYKRPYATHELALATLLLAGKRRDAHVRYLCARFLAQVHARITDLRASRHTALLAGVSFRQPICVAARLIAASDDGFNELLESSPAAHVCVYVRARLIGSTLSA